MAHGGKRKGAGRKPGATEEEIKEARLAIAKFCDLNSKKIQGWFDEVAKEDSGKALEILYKYLEFHVPKLARTENKNETNVTYNIGTGVPSLPDEAS